MVFRRSPIVSESTDYIFHVRPSKHITTAPTRRIYVKFNIVY